MKKIQASTIAEVVIALTIIAICFAVASQVFLQSNRSTVQFMEVKEQTEFQSAVMEAFMKDTLPVSNENEMDLCSVEDIQVRKDSMVAHTYNLSDNEKLVWQQEFFYEK